MTPVPPHPTPRHHRLVKAHSSIHGHPPRPTPARQLNQHAGARSSTLDAKDRRFNYTTPKSFLELIALYKAMLANRRAKIDANIKKLSDGVIKLESTAESVAGLEEEIKIKAVEVEAKKAEVEAMIPKLEEEKAKASEEASKANVIAASATKKETEVIAMKADIETKLAAAEPAISCSGSNPPHGSPLTALCARLLLLLDYFVLAGSCMDVPEAAAAADPPVGLFDSRCYRLWLLPALRWTRST